MTHKNNAVRGLSADGVFVFTENPAASGETS